jgi:hypothetical protein
VRRCSSAALCLQRCRSGYGAAFYKGMLLLRCRVLHWLTMKRRVNRQFRPNAFRISNFNFNLKS